jgi:hypothetical protein
VQYLIDTGWLIHRANASEINSSTLDIVSKYPLPPRLSLKRPRDRHCRDRFHSRRLRRSQHRGLAAANECASLTYISGCAPSSGRSAAVQRCQFDGS